MINTWYGKLKTFHKRPYLAFNKALLHQFDLFEGIFETLKFCLYPDLCDGAVEGHRGLKGGENKEMLGSNTGQG